MIDKAVVLALGSHIAVPDVDVNTNTQAKWASFLKNVATLITIGHIDFGTLNSIVLDNANKLGASTVQPRFGGTATDYPTFTMIAFIDFDWPERELELAVEIIVTSIAVFRRLKEEDRHYRSRLASAARHYRRLFIDRSLKLTSLPDDRSQGWLGRLGSEHLDNEQAINDLKLLTEAALIGTGGHERQGGVRGEIVRREIQRVSDDQMGEFDFATGNSKSNFTAMRAATSEGGNSKHSILPRNRARKSSAIEHKVKKRGRTNAIKRNAQVISVGHGKPSDTAIGHLVKLLITQEFDREARLALLTILLTGRSLKEIQTMMCVKSIDAVPGQIGDRIYIDKDATALLVPAHRPDGAREVGKDWERFVRTTVEQIFLPIPDALRPAIEKALAEARPGKKGVRVFSGTAAEIEAATKEIFKSEMLPIKHRLTLKKIQSYLPAKLVTATGGRNIASLLLGFSVGGVIDSQSYYLCQRQLKLSELYFQSTNEVLDRLGILAPTRLSTLDDQAKVAQWINERRQWVGSHVRSEIKAYRALGYDMRIELARLYNQRHTENSQQEIHNLLTLYVFTGLQIATGFRPLRSPFKGFDEIDPVSGVVRLNDKSFDDSHAFRFAWAPPGLLRLIGYYRVRRDSFIRLLDLESEPAPFFFIGESGRIIDATLGQIDARSKEFWPVPTNSPRHFLVNYLFEQNLRPQLIDMIMGHWGAGEEPLAAPSMISLADMLAEVEQPIINLWRQIDWKTPKALTK